MIRRMLDAIFRRDDGRVVRMPSADDLVCVALPEGEPEALMLRDLLAGAGIHALVKSRLAAGSAWGGAAGPGAFELYVARRDARRARDLLAPDQPAPDPSDTA